MWSTAIVHLNIVNRMRSSAFVIRTALSSADGLWRSAISFVFIVCLIYCCRRSIHVDLFAAHSAYIMAIAGMLSFSIVIPAFFLSNVIVSPINNLYRTLNYCNMASTLFGSWYAPSLGYGVALPLTYSISASADVLSINSLGNNAMVTSVL